MTFINQADETRRQAREGKEKGVPEARQARPPIEGEKVKYVDVFVDGGSGGNNSSTENGSGADGGDGETTETQGATENTSSGGSSSTGGSGTTFNADDPSTWAQESGTGSGAYSGDDMEAATSTQGATCIGCDVNEMGGITEGDCAGGSGGCFKIHYDGVFPTPDGWDDPDTPPESPVDGWGLGYYYKLRLASANRYPDMTHQASMDILYPETDNGVGSWFTVNRAKSAVVGNIPQPSIYYNRYTNGTWSGGVWSYAEFTINRKTDGVERGRIYVDKVTCSAGEMGVNPMCPVEAPTTSPDSWPDDGCYDLIFDGLAFKGHDSDPNLPDKYKGAGTSSVNYCTDGGSDGATRTAVDGGFQIETSDMIRVYDSDGNLTAAGDKTQVFKERYQP